MAEVTLVMVALVALASEAGRRKENEGRSKNGLAIYDRCLRNTLMQSGSSVFSREESDLRDGSVISLLKTCEEILPSQQKAYFRTVHG